MPARRSTRVGSWRYKFAHAFRGVKRGVRGESSFFAHFFVMAAVIAAAGALEVSRGEWCLLVLCIAAVLTAEMLNTALERLAAAVQSDYSPHLRDALDIGSGAVLLASLGAAVVGAIIFIHRIGVLADWWPVG